MEVAGGVAKGVGGYIDECSSGRAEGLAVCNWGCSWECSWRLGMSLRV